MSPQQPFLKIDAATESDAYVIRVEGELDAAGCPELEAALADADRSQAPRIVVDLDRLNWIDGYGLETLLRASRRSASGGNRLRLRAGRGDVALMLRLMMLEVKVPVTEPARPPAGRRKVRDRPRISALGESLSAHLLRLQEEAKMARRRFHRYKAKTYGSRFTDPERLFELERGFLIAEDRLRAANPAAGDTGNEQAPGSP
jgi:anti-anti-sigma factor